MRRICWPWCEHRRKRRALRREIAGIDWVEDRGGWIPGWEAERRDALIAELEALK